MRPIIPITMAPIFIETLLINKIIAKSNISDNVFIIPTHFFTLPTKIRFPEQSVQKLVQLTEHLNGSILASNIFTVNS